MQSNLLKVLGVLAIVATLVCFIFAALGMIGAVKVGNGCYMRYDANGKVGTDSITSTITLNANANYVNTSKILPDGTTQLIPDPTRYGEWLNTQVLVENSQPVNLQVVGQISLCLAYIPKDNLQRTGPGSNLDDNGKMILIPRINNANTPPVSLIMDAKNSEWRNIAELYANDRVLVSVSPNFAGTEATVNDAFKGTAVTKDCSQGKTSYEPICGKYSIYSGQYVNACELKQNYWQGNRHREECHCIVCINQEDVAQWVCDSANLISHCCAGFICDSLPVWINHYGTMPESYKDDGSFTFSWSDNSGNLFIDYSNLQCSNNANISPNGQCPDSVDNRSPKDKDYIGGVNCISGICNDGDFQKNRRFWYTADGKGGKGPTGLIYQMNDAGSVSQALPSNLEFAKFVADSDQPPEYKDKDGKYIYKVIYNIPFNSNIEKSYLQYRLWSPTSQDASKNTGGYVLNIKQTKCYRENGNSFNDTFDDRGRVQYIIVSGSENPNTSGKPYSPQGINVDSDGKANVNANGDGYIWMRILNDSNDYKDSNGNYKVHFSTSLKVGSFTIKVMNPLLQLFKTKVQGAATSIFKNMVCYKASDSSSCINFFTYIKAILILYVMTYGAMFLLGFAKINQKELVIRIAKIGVVSGLINGNTFEFFNNYLFDAITGFSDAIIANMSGYSLFTSTNTISNPFMFLDAVMSKIFFSQTFIAQLLALLSLGLSGIIYFIITFIALGIVIITALRAIAVYIMAFMATCILIGIAPLFISFLLFDFTRYLFDNWVRFTIRYMIEPVVMMAGIIVLTQLFTIYLDFVLGYSVCWKCALPIKIPFIGTILPIALLNVPIFCINWFAPWGMDYMSGMMGVNMQNIVALVIIAYGMYGYVEFSGRMVAKLTSAAGPSATGMGEAMYSAAEQKILSQVGMDAETRRGITGRAEARLKQRNKTLDQAEKNRKNTLQEGGEKTNEEPPKPETPK
ncbi:MAG: type IV secretion system protein [Rickettsia endosymbiont of Ixodes persulcatus]|nr:type IV secretion system protein [Rickettsia endosymbiont of Ixodes persulcatus]MCZ6902233.1 type IV secretion system protein [Rickettsia endosymbiont of Ixodes persulcatus]MCZ6902948.1 type IV secretion system protein [Rickettsia endosymbiont of Ixodes persulcatus]MCZ6908578.1 type IV secretion system protein [Rickettsia endosymbiont of Ixodes persulcatus]MCZ6909970.1 type IV secretion system protein [Rickettsia endosymbiont of Ixodes persulcatus]